MLNRREVVLGSAGLLAAVGSAAAADKAPAAGAPAHELAAAAAECVRVGEACLQHCLDLMAAGDASLGGCAKSVTQMLAICKAIGPFAVAGAKQLPALARVCADVCTDCERECRKHETHHAICKQCADVCARVASEAKKVAA